MLLDDGQHAVAHWHAGQQQGGAIEGTAAGDEDHRRAAHEAHETAVGCGGTLEGGLGGPFEERPQTAAVGQLLPRDELRTGAPFGLAGMRRTCYHFAVAEVEGDAAPLQTAVDEQSHRFLSFHNSICFNVFCNCI